MITRRQKSVFRCVRLFKIYMAKGKFVLNIDIVGRKRDPVRKMQIFIRDAKEVNRVMDWLLRIWTPSNPSITLLTSLASLIKICTFLKGLSKDFLLFVLAAV